MKLHIAEQFHCHKDRTLCAGRDLLPPKMDNYFEVVKIFLIDKAEAICCQVKFTVIHQLKMTLN